MAEPAPSLPRLPEPPPARPPLNGIGLFVATSFLIGGLVIIGFGIRKAVAFGGEPRACELADCLAKVESSNWVRVVDAHVQCAPSVSVNNKSAVRNYSLLAGPPGVAPVLYEIRGKSDACAPHEAEVPRGELTEGNERFGEYLRENGATFLPRGRFYILNGNQSGNGLPPILFGTVVLAIGIAGIVHNLRRQR